MKKKTKKKHVIRRINSINKYIINKIIYNSNIFIVILKLDIKMIKTYLKNKIINLKEINLNNLDNYIEKQKINNNILKIMNLKKIIIKMSKMIKMKN